VVIHYLLLRTTSSPAQAQSLGGDPTRRVRCEELPAHGLAEGLCQDEVEIEDGACREPARWDGGAPGQPSAQELAVEALQVQGAMLCER